MYQYDLSNPATFQPADVLEDNTWEYKWQTSNLNIDAGTYTVYAVATASDKSMLSDTQYATVSVIIRKPFISAQASQSVVAAGDKLFIRGTAAGQPTQGIAVWILGKNKVIYDTASVNADGTFEQEISQGTTADLAAGQYFVVAQHPMYNEIFDVFPASSVPGQNNQDIVAGVHTRYQATPCSSYREPAASRDPMQQKHSFRHSTTQALMIPTRSSSSSSRYQRSPFSQ